MCADRVSNGLCIKCGNIVREGLKITDNSNQAELCGFCLGDYIKELIEEQKITREDFGLWIKS